jgi:enamine deaminase RidA (YjgF/YER057c/UK114 family)
MAATAGARTRSANESAPEDDQQVPAEDAPGVAREIRCPRPAGRRGYDAHIPDCNKFDKIGSQAVKHFCSTLLAAALLCGMAASDLSAQKKKKKPASDDEGYIPVVAPENDKNKKKKNEDFTQTLPPPPELPLALAADTSRLAFAVSPLSGKGLLSQQTRDALNALLRKNHGTIVKLRAFVAGSGDLRRVGELVGEIFTEKHEPLPVLSLVQIGALPMGGAQVVIESVEMDRKGVNPHGVAFFSGQAAETVGQAIEKLKNALTGTGMEPSDVLRATCFVSSLDEQRDTSQLMAASFPSAALNYVQMQREPVAPAADCEMIARVRAPMRPSVADSGPSTYLAIAPGSKLIITGTQLAFGSQEGDLKLAFERLQKALTGSNARLDRVVMSHLYTTSTSLEERLRIVQAQYSMGPNTMLPVEGLPSLDARFGVDVVALADR